MDLAEYEKFKTTIANGAKEMLDKNKSIYMDFVPTDISTLPKIDKKIMVSAKPMTVKKIIYLFLNLYKKYSLSYLN